MKLIWGYIRQFLHALHHLLSSKHQGVTGMVEDRKFVGCKCGTTFYGNKEDLKTANKMAEEVAKEIERRLKEKKGSDG